MLIKIEYYGLGTFAQYFIFINRVGKLLKYLVTCAFLKIVASKHSFFEIISSILMLKLCLQCNTVSTLQLKSCQKKEKRKKKKEKRKTIASYNALISFSG